MGEGVCVCTSGWDEAKHLKNGRCWYWKAVFRQNQNWKERSMPSITPSGETEMGFQGYKDGSRHKSGTKEE